MQRDRISTKTCTLKRKFLRNCTLGLLTPSMQTLSLILLVTSYSSNTDCCDWLLHLLISQATRPFTSMTSEEVANPRRRSTRFRHFSSSICSTVRAFFNSRFAALISPAIYRHTDTHVSTLSSYPWLRQTILQKRIKSVDRYEDKTWEAETNFLINRSNLETVRAYSWFQSYSWLLKIVIMVQTLQSTQTVYVCDIELDQACETYAWRKQKVFECVMIV